MDRRVIDALLEYHWQDVGHPQPKDPIRDALLYMAGYIEALEQRVAVLEARNTPFGFPVDWTAAAAAPISRGETFFTNAVGQPPLKVDDV